MVEAEDNDTAVLPRAIGAGIGKRRLHAGASSGRPFSERMQVWLPESRLFRSLPALLLYLVASTWMWHALVTHLRTRASGGGQGDPGLLMWWLRWVPYALGHGLNPLYTHYVNAPAGASAMWNVSVTALGAVFAPITEIFGVVVTFNVLCILGPALSVWTCNTWLRRHVGPVPALLGGLVLAFSPVVVEQGEGGHLMMTWLLLLPLIAMLLENILWRSNRPWWPSGPILGLVVVTQLLIGEEVLVMMTLSVVICICLIAVAHPRQALARLKPAALGCAAALGVALVLGAWPLYEQFKSGSVVHGPIQGIDVWEGEP